MALAVGFTIKIIYLFFIGPAVYGKDLLIARDAFSYTNSFINLVNTGEYTHTPGHEPASYGRLPGIPFIWGFFYLLFGIPKAYTAFALFQIMLDFFAGVMIFKIIRNFFHQRTALIVAWCYVLFPLTTYFVVRTDADYLSLFSIILVFYQLVFFRPYLKHCILLAVSLIAAFFIRETLILLMPISFFYLARNYKISLNYYFSMILLIFVLYLPWPIRNYIKADKIILVKPVSAGYSDYTDDILGYMSWVYSWHNCDAEDCWIYVYDLEKEIDFPDKIFNTPTEKKLASDLVILAQRQGTGFLVWRNRNETNKINYGGKHDALINRGFNLLERSFKINHPFIYYVKIPLQNLRKALFKNSLTFEGPTPSFIFKFIMIARTIFVLLGIFACFYYWRSDYFKISLFFSMGIYLFFSFVFRHVEMRYLFQADVLMMVAAMVFIAEKIFRRDAFPEGTHLSGKKIN